MADMLDVSGEHLARMKEEAGLTDMDTLMRYIRVFSELSGQLRYATQKRVTAEIALIRLCRPQMEQNYDSILHRIALLEQRMEEGVPAAPASMTGVPAPSDGICADKKPEKISPEALPEDIQNFLSRFQELRKKVSPWFQMVLKGAQCRELPEHAGVQIVLCKNHPVDETELAAEIEQMVLREMNLRLKIQISIPGEDERAGEPVIDLSGFIDMKIDIDEN